MKRKPLLSTVAKARAFLAAYRKSANLTASARAAGIGVRNHYRWIEEYPAYAEAFKRAHLVARQFLKDKAIEFSTVGWTEPVFYQGVLCGHVKRRDSGLHQMLLRGAFPEEFGKKVELSGKDGAPIDMRLEVVFVEAAAEAL
jgi:hypothetical protein